jgi:hypothetical protein
MPAVPQDSGQCLIAKNLNFNCHVAPGFEFDRANSDEWVMVLPDEPTRDTIASKLGLRPLTRKTRNFVNQAEDIEYAVILPLEIGEVAQAFDDAFDQLTKLDEELDDLGGVDPSDYELLGEMLPYIEASVIEAYELAGDHIKDGKLIL